ncbi:phage portal protein [Weissella oryzae SG25]|uniref:Phage portal protein n=1 Tax=Weissella oryzae (strain DSM 25784 / JCM 18191 / LMG 30913 / SG25) TaxID=1329250 RepID=A0A069CXN0_WEIOS|nr:phage portal protein [Weissella oryzae]GAK32008.1 phage portal protein [Weissella oryzae SG25]
MNNTLNNVAFLSGSRYSPNANDVFMMSPDTFADIGDNPTLLMNYVQDYISTFRSQQLRRLNELKRYYKGDNNIKYRKSDRDKNRADNRISSDWGKYVATFMQGFILGNPVQYQNEDDALIEKIETFGSQNNEDYHNGLIETDLSIYGRAYELIYIGPDGKEHLAKLQPEQTFVVYDGTIESNSLFGVRFYQVAYSQTNVKGFVEIYTPDNVFYFEGDESITSMSFVREEPLFLGAVPINEYSNNEERMGDYEAVLDIIDAYDLSQSELANFQQDMNDAYLTIIGNPITGTNKSEYQTDSDGNIVLDDNGDPILADNSEGDVLEQMLKARMLILDNNNDPNGPNPNAFYLKKEYDSAGAEAYKKRLVADILRFTFTPDTNDENFAGTQSGEAMKYKLMGNDNLAKTKQRLLIKGFMRRLRLLGNSWGIKNSVSTATKIDSLYDKLNETTIKFTPNIPQNDEERISQLKQLFGVISDETLFALLSSFTGVDADDEMQRLKEQKEDSMIVAADAVYKNSNLNQEATKQSSTDEE